MLVKIGMVQEHLRGDAPDVQTGAPEKTVLLDDHGFQSPLRGPNGGLVPSRPAADDCQVVCGQALPPFPDSLHRCRLARSKRRGMGFGWGIESGARIAAKLRAASTH